MKKNALILRLALCLLLMLLAAGAFAEAGDAPADVFTTEKDAALFLRSELKAHEPTIRFRLITDREASEEMTLEMFDLAVRHTGVPDEGTYLKLQVQGFACDLSCTETDAERYIDVTYHVTYMTTLEQEQQVNEAVASLLAEMNLSGLSGEEKVAAIYQYIVSNVAYDHVHLGDQTYSLQYTAYAALINKTAVCQGYSMLFYRLALEAGLDARYVTGTANGENHGWNIVKPEDDGVYYHIDATHGATSDAEAFYLFGSSDTTDREIHTDLSAFSIAEHRYGYVAPDICFFFATEEEFRAGMDAAVAEKKNNFLVQYAGPEVSTEYEFQMISTYLTNWWKVSGIPTYNVQGCYHWGYVEWDYTIVVLAYADPEAPENPFIYQTDDFTYLVEDDHVVIGQYTGSATKVTVPATIGGYPVTTLSRYAFDQNGIVEEIILPEGLTTIQNGDVDTVWYGRFTSAFHQCTSLRSISLPSTLRSIGNYSFNGCTSLQEVTLNKELTELGINVFENCTSLSRLTLPDNLAYFNTNCISGTAITTLHLPAGLQEYQSINGDCYIITLDEDSPYLTLLDDVLYTKGLLKCVYYPHNKTDAEYTVPEGCTYFSAWENPYLKKLYLPSTIERIPLSPGIEYVAIDEDNPAYCSVDGVVFTRDMKTLYVYPPCKKDEVYHIPDGVEQLAYGGNFHQNQYIRKVYIPASVTYIAVGFRESTIEEVVFAEGSRLRQMDGAFEYCNNLRSITLPDGLESMYHTFDQCENLAFVSIPDSVTWIDNFTFRDTAIRGIRLPANLQVLGYQVFYRSDLKYAYIPGTIELADLGAFDDSTTIVGKSGSFAEQYAAEAGLPFLPVDRPTDNVMLLPAELTALGSEALAGTAAQIVIIPEGCATVAADAFDRCESLHTVINLSPASITAPDGVDVFNFN